MMRSFLILLAVTSTSSFILTPSGRDVTVLAANRRDFLDASIMAGAALLVGQPAVADDDLEMPTEEEQKVRLFPVFTGVRLHMYPLYSTLRRSVQQIQFARNLLLFGTGVNE